MDRECQTCGEQLPANWLSTHCAYCWGADTATDMNEPCPECKGTGRLTDSADPDEYYCSYCDSEGRVTPDDVLFWDKVNDEL